MALSGKIIGGDKLIVSLKTRSAAAVFAVRRTVRQLGLELERLVKTRYLNGLALNRRTGRLARDVNTIYTESATSATSSTGTKVIYGAAWERGFTVPPREILPRAKKALFWEGARHPVAKVMQAGRHERARPFLRPALHQMTPTIRKRLKEAATTALAPG